METHTLTTEQVQKFINAIGGVMPQSVASGQFTTQQLKTLAEIEAFKALAKSA